MTPMRENQTATTDDEIRAVLASPAASGWIKRALESALERDPVDAVNDAEFLLSLLSARLDRTFRHSRAV